MDKELLTAISQMMDEKLNPVHKSIDDMQRNFEGMHRSIDDIHETIDDMHRSIDDLNIKIESEVAKINIKIENDVTKRLDSLFDGYMLTHEKQYELERQFAALQRRVEAFETKVS